ncbi:MAG TPA: flagellar basal body-associated FliL family protein [Roseiarcus sp.]|nr:flagellar basal body-associated FliL family protein [Roseiarcus sp.]
MADTALPQSLPAPKRMGSLAELAVVLLVGAAVGVGFEVTWPAATTAEKPAGPAAPAEPSTVYDLPPIVTNLGAPQEVWIRLEGSIVFDPKTAPHPETLAAEIGTDILAYLRTVSLKQIEGPIGLEAIREDLNDRAAIRSRGAVREFVIRTLVVQ